MATEFETFRFETFGFSPSWTSGETFEGILSPRRHLEQQEPSATWLMVDVQ